ncbi:MAG: glucose-6-phosphate isomerase [Nitrospirae bacterium]|nr:glucose-6-phosphate isomerase [Nitrospirota bacterium]
MITLDFTNMMADSIGKDNGLSRDDLNSLKDRIKAIHTEISERRIPEFYFLELPNSDTRDIGLIGESIRSNSDYFLVLGIGGSALGPRSLLEALKPFYNMKHVPKIFIYDNVDPSTLESILSTIDLKKTTVNVITKSGSTVETMASFLILMRLMKEAHRNKFSKHIIATTDPEKGTLREIAEKEGFRTLTIHPHVVGRYSVLSPVGLFLGAVAGINIKGLLNGARDMLKKCSVEDIWENPAYMASALMYLIGQKKNKDISVLLPYSDRLKTFSEWYCQLWAESLGKNGLGQTPYPAIGTTDQHSQLQLWIEGPKDKVVTFIKIDDHGTDITIPEENIPAMSYLNGHSIGELISAEQEATELSLQKARIPNMRLNMPMIDSYYMGQLFLFFELTSAVTGMLYGVNPFNQPAVEEGKNLTYGIMGHKGYEDKCREVFNYRGKIQELKYKI